jgi:NAD(P)-dependent dehydrogenase (short-subunit alcohol dehydrogenase family)
MTAERIARLLRVNVTGAFLCAREAVRRMPPGGAIVNVSSRAGVLGAPASTSTTPPPRRRSTR